MLVCPLCSDVSVNALSHLMTHIRLIHADDPHFIIQCSFQGCTRTFRKFTVYRNHVYSYHDTTTLETPENTDMDTREHTDPPTLWDDQSCAGEGSTTTTNPQLIISEHMMKNAATKWILKMREGHRIPQSVMESIVSGASSLFQLALSGLQQTLQTRFMNAHVSTDVSSMVMDCLNCDSQYTRVFQGLETSYKQNAYIRANFPFVAPTNVVLGTRQKPAKAGESREIREVKDCVVYVPILKTLQRLLENEDVVAQIYRGHSSQHPGVLSDYCDGQNYRSHPLFSRNELVSLQILLYYDDIEVVNPIGSHKAVHKLGVFYFSLGNLHPKYRSQYSSIHLVALCKRKYINLYSMSDVLKPLIEDIKRLEGGYLFRIGDIEETVYGTICVISADNPANNLLGGFKETSAAYRMCRQCMATTLEANSKFEEEAFTLRSRAQHLIHCASLEDDPANFEKNSKEFGVNYRSELLELRYFDICGGGLVADVMHDLLEGTLQYETKLILKHVINQRYITYKTFADLLEGLELGYMEMDNKPTMIPARVITSDDKHLGQKAAQMWLLGRVLPYMIGEYIPPTDEHWQNYLQLLDIVDLLFAPSITEDEVGYLSVLIDEHHQTFVSLYSNSKLLPKHHYMIHMPRLVIEFGPIVRYWTMRYEAKHNHLKKLAQNIGNFINVAWTLANRLQYWQCYQWSDGAILRADNPDIGPGDEVAEGDRPSELCAADQCYKANWIKISGCLYKPNCVVVLGVEDDYPVFGLTKALFVVDSGQVYFEVTKLITVHYNCHRHLYVIRRSPQTLCIAFNTLYIPFPLHCRRAHIDGLTCLTVVVKYHILGTVQC